MNDPVLLDDALADLRLALAGDDLEPPTALRVRVLTPVEQPAAAPLPLVVVRHWPRRRTVALLTVAAAVGATVAVAPAFLDGGEGPPAVAQLDARTVLLAAAERARMEKQVVPRPDQFVYTRTREKYPVVVLDEKLKDGQKRSWDGYREAWLSVDGSRAGAVTPSGSERLVRLPADGLPAYPVDAPRTAEAMRALLYPRGVKGPDSHFHAFERGAGMLQEEWVLPETQAALFEVLAAIPGVEVTQDAVTVTGVHGVAVGRAAQGTRTELIFDKRTFEVLSRRSVQTDNRFGRKAGQVLGESAVVEQALVDRVRERPDGTLRPRPVHDE
jgi:hypothetical protein